MVICLERDADLHMAQLMPLPLTVSCFSKIQIGFTFLVPAHLCSPGKRAVKLACVCVCVCSYQQLTSTYTCDEWDDSGKDECAADDAAWGSLGSTSLIAAAVPTVSMCIPIAIATSPSHASIIWRPVTSSAPYHKATTSVCENQWAWFKKHTGI